MDISVRQAKKEDESAILEMAEKFYNTTVYSESIPFDLETCKNTFKQSLKERLCYVALCDKEPVGFVLGISSPSLMNANFSIGIEIAWWVEEDYRKGTGTKLKEAIEKRAEKMGLKFWSMVALETHEPELVGQMYTDTGYIPTERVFTRVH